MFRISYLAALVVGAAIVAGCGGAGSSATGGSSSTASTQATMGNATLKFQGKLQSKIGTDTGQISIVGAAGANITEFNYNPASVIANSAIAFSDGQEVYLYSNGVQSEVTSSTEQIVDYCFDKYGHLLLSMFDPATGCIQIFECAYDGSGLTRITSNAESHVSVSAKYDDSAILFSDGTNLKTINFSGGNETVIEPGSKGRYSPNATQIAYTNSTGFYISSATGTSQFNLSNYQNNYVQGMNWSPDGSKVAVSAQGDCFVVSATGGDLIQINNGEGSDSSPAIGPDGKSIAYLQQASGTVVNSLITGSLDGFNSTTLLSSNSGTTLSNPIWSSYFGSKSFAGPTGSLFPTAAGFLWSERGSGFSSLLCFTAATPSAATITAETDGETASSSVFDCHADTITGLKYLNGYYFAPVSITPNVSDILVSFDSTTGQVGTIAPFAATKGTRKVSGTVATYTGKFPAIYDGKGKNLAPAGAASVSLDLKTGKLLNWR